MYKMNISLVQRRGMKYPKANLLLVFVWFVFIMSVSFIVFFQGATKWFGSPAALGSGSRDGLSRDVIIDWVIGQRRHCCRKGINMGVCLLNLRSWAIFLWKSLVGSMIHIAQGWMWKCETRETRIKCLRKNPKHLTLTHTFFQVFHISLGHALHLYRCMA